MAKGQRSTAASRAAYATRALAGEDRHALAAEAGVTRETIGVWVHRHRLNPPTEPPVKLAPAVGPVDVHELSPLERARLEVDETRANIAAAEAAMSYTALAALRKHLRGIMQDLEALEAQDRDGIDGGDPVAVGYEVALLCRVPILAAEVVADEEARAALLEAIAQADACT